MFVRCDDELSDDLTDSRGPNRRSFGLFHFAGNGGLTVMVTGPSVPKHNYNTNNNNNKKDYAVLLSDSTSRSNLQLSKSGHIALFCFKL